MGGRRLGIAPSAARICMSGLVLLGALSTFRAPPAAADTAPAWPKVRLDATNTAFNTSESWLSTGNVASLALDWSTRLNPRESPLVAGGVIYAGCEDDSFCALDATNGSVRWKTLVGPAAPSRWAALAGGVVYTTGGLSPSVMALDAGTGTVLWKTLIVNGAGGQSTPIAVAEGLVVEGWGYSLFAWDAATGIQRWVVPLPAGGPPQGVVPAGGVPAIVNGVVYFQDSTSPTLYALRATTGETLWTSDRATGTSGTPLVTAGLVIVAGHQDPSSASGRLSAYSAAGCGTSPCPPVWQKDVSPAPSGSGAVAGGVLYQGLADGSYAAMEAVSGRPLWKAATAFSGQPVATATGGATIANGLLFGQAGGYLYAWAAAGCGTAVCQPLWSTPIGGGTWTAGDTVVAHGRLYVVNRLVAHGSVPESGDLLVFSPRQNPPPPLSPPPLVPFRPAPVRTVPTTLNVPGDHLSIQRAIDASIPGDIVVVAPGVYHERLDFHGRAVEVRSAGGPEVTTIDGDGLSTVVVFQSKETRASVLRGFTIRNGITSRSGGGGIRMSWASPTIAGNVITRNQAGGGNGIHVTGGAPAIVGNQLRHNKTRSGLGATGGGAIALLDADSGVEVRGNVIEDNSAGHGGGLAASSTGSMTIADNVIRRNTAGEKGGGVMLSGGDDVLFVQNVVVDNTVVDPGWGGGVFASGSPTVLANTIAGNASARASAVDASGGVPGMTFQGNVITGPPGTSVVECEQHFDWSLPSFLDNIVHNGDARPSVVCGDDSLSADPRFVNPGDGDYRLGRGSPAIDAGVASPLLWATDVAGAPRVVDGDGDGVATVDIGAYEGQPPLPDVVGDGFHSVTPARLLDTRSGVGAPAQRLGQGRTIDLQVSGRSGVPATGVSSVVLNVTVTETTATSFLTAWPAGLTRPLASNLNYDAGRTVPNMVTVKVGAGGKVSLYNNSGSTHVVADVAGWYGAAGGSAYTSVTPSRILDTRAGVGAPTAPVAAMSTLSLKVTGQGRVPEAGVSAVVLNVTVTEPTATSFLTAWPAGVARPLASNLNYVAAQTVPNLVVVKVGDGGRINLYNHAGTAHVIADVAGWFGDGAESTFTALPPARILDTRTAAKPGPASVLDLQVTGRGGVPAIGVSAVVLNVTVTEPTAISFLTGWPAGVTRPLASNLNYVPSLTVPNLVVVKVDERGRVSLYNHDGLAHVIADVAGWYG